MISDQVTEEIDVEETTRTKASKSIAVLLDIDGKLEVNRSPLKRQQKCAKARTQNNDIPLDSRESSLRHIIHLQRQLLAQQGDRVQRQQSLIISLNNDLTRQQSRIALESKTDRTKLYHWLSSLIPFKNSSK